MVRVRVGVGLMVSSPQFKVLRPKIVHCLTQGGTVIVSVCLSVCLSVSIDSALYSESGLHAGSAQETTIEH